MSKQKSNLTREFFGNEDDEWLFETILTYLSSPIWSMPIQHFVEANCSIFSPSDSWSGGALLDDDDDENLEKVPTELIDVHLKYKDLVDTLIKAFLQDLGVSYDKFLKACKSSARINDYPVYMDLLEQVWCAENFSLFRALMVRKNVELELQALVLLQYQLGLIKSGQSELNSQTADDEIMSIVIKKSKDEYDNLTNNRQKIFKDSNNHLPIQKPLDFETAKKLVKSEKFVEHLKSELDHHELLNQKLIEQQLNQTQNKNNNLIYTKSDRIESQNNNLILTDKNIRNKEKYNERDDNDDIISNIKTSKVVGAIAQSVVPNSSENLTQNEIERRTEFMRKQREILTERKKIERQKQLDEFMHESKRTGESRPMSSKAARIILSGSSPNEIEQKIGDLSLDEERKKIEARKVLAETLKKEVINNSKRN